MKSISVYDLKLIPELSHLTYFDFVNPANDALVNPFLYEMGFELRKGLSYTVSKHRTMQNTIEVGFVIRGEVRTDREFLRGPYATLEDRIAAAALTDMSLCAELCYKMGTLSSIGAYETGKAEDGAEKDFPESLTEADEGEVLSTIAVLESLLADIRGSQNRADGSLKRPEDYQEKEVSIDQPRRKLRSKRTLTAI